MAPESRTSRAHVIADHSQEPRKTPFRLQSGEEGVVVNSRNRRQKDERDEVWVIGGVVPGHGRDGARAPVQFDDVEGELSALHEAELRPLATEGATGRLIEAIRILESVLGSANGRQSSGARVSNSASLASLPLGGNSTREALNHSGGTDPSAMADPTSLRAHRS